MHKTEIEELISNGSGPLDKLSTIVKDTMKVKKGIIRNPRHSQVENRPYLRS